MPRMRCGLRAVLLAVLCANGTSFLLGIDFGSQYFKACVVAAGKPFEIVHNQHSKRKTPTAVSFAEKIRTFGDDAIASASKGVKKTPMFFPMQLGRNFTEEARAPYWLPKQFYQYDLGVTEAGGLRFELGADAHYTAEETAAHVLHFAMGLAHETVQGAKLSEAVLTVNSQATMHERKAILSAAEIATLPRAHLVHETSAAALHRGLDLMLTGENGTQQTSTVLYYNMGATHTEACIVHYTGANHSGKPTVAMDVRGCGVDHELGGHMFDITVAEKMLATFKEKYPKLADIDSSARALRKLEKEANAMKHVLSANKEAQFRVESLYEDTDFFQPVKRETFEGWCKSLFDRVSHPIEKALVAANATLGDIDTVEMIGGGWRIPQVQTLLQEYLQKGRPSDMPELSLSQHINGDEAMATGAAFYGANNSLSFRTKKIFFTDTSPHSYSLVLRPLNKSQPHEEGWRRAVELFPAGSKLRARKTVKLTQSFDVHAALFENENPVVEWAISGVHQATTEKYPDLGTPLVSLKVELDTNGIVRMASATAIFDEHVLVEEAPSAPANATSGNDTTAGAGNDTAAESGGEEKHEPTQEEINEEKNEAESPGGDAQEETGNATAGNNTGEPAYKIKKRKVNLDVLEQYDSVLPRPLDATETASAKKRLAEMEAADAAVRKTDAAKNALEAFVYEAREKVGEDEAVQKVSTEEDRDAIRSKLMEIEDWLYEEEAANGNASVFEAKHQDLQMLVYPILARASELNERPQLDEIIPKVRDYVNMTLDYVQKNMTWVNQKEIEGVQNLTKGFEEWFANVSAMQEKLSLTAEPAYSTRDAKMKLHKMQTEAQRLTKIKKIDPIPYSNYGRGGAHDDPYMRAYYDSMYKNFSKNGSFSDWYRNNSNLSNFSGWNESDYMRAYYEHMAKNFSRSNFSDTDKTNQTTDAEPEGKNEL